MSIIYNLTTEDLSKRVAKFYKLPAYYHQGFNRVTNQWLHEDPTRCFHLAVTNNLRLNPSSVTGKYTFMGMLSQVVVKLEKGTDPEEAYCKSILECLVLMKGESNEDISN